MYLCIYARSRITNFALFLPKGGSNPIWDCPEITDKSDCKPISHIPALNIRLSFDNEAFSTPQTPVSSQMRLRFQCYGGVKLKAT